MKRVSVEMPQSGSENNDPCLPDYRSNPHDRINGKPYTYHTYKEIINKARATFHISIRNNDALLLVEDCQGRNAGSVAYKSSVILKDSRTGAEIESESVILATVEWKDEKRILTELTEVTK